MWEGYILFCKNRNLKADNLNSLILFIKRYYTYGN